MTDLPASNPDIHRDYPIDDSVLAAFRRDGFVHLRDVLPAEVLADYGREITRLTIALNTQTLPLEERTTYDRAFLQVMNLWQQSPVVRDFVFGRTLARIAADLLEVQGVRLYHDQSLYKEPGGGITPAHADQYYWPLASDRTVTAWIPLQPVPRELGPLAFYAGSHRSVLGRDLPISDESEAAITAAMEAQAFPIVDEPFDLGDVSFHAGWLFHKAGPNVSRTPRSVMTIIYMDAAMRLAEPVNEPQRADRDRWCSGVETGAIIDTPGNPLLFDRAAA
ncbi:phytanoyl-CoA dioxygenase family protein [Brevundimonas sp.]|jgi:ectoine hydroxylase-related dioxygenase (phytanoyl-CoA dioxygenase family)|uniref:phytanoyl-CoA dioxygenase family protein n=1 Tax=Brevundimonas sp. TaxID=1871086 RepID=UPI00262B93DF|nr:phytanoyl-CoA dioxygenase family protein [Brevundimonas sp.]